MSISAFQFVDGAVVPVSLDVAVKSIRSTTPTGLCWIAISGNAAEYAPLLRDQLGLHPLAVEDAVSQRQRPKMERYDGHSFITAYQVQVSLDKSRKSPAIQLLPIAMFVGANWLVTVDAGTCDPVETTLHRWQSRPDDVRNSTWLLHALLDAIVDEYFPVVDRCADLAEDIERKIFDGGSVRIMEEVFRLKRDIARFRHTTGPTRDAVNVLLRREDSFLDPAALPWLQDVYDHLLRITEQLDSLRDLLGSAQEAALAIASNDLNKTVQRLTSASIILMTATLIAGIYGMNFRYMPELQWAHGYAFAMGLMVATSLPLAWWFRRKGWL